MATSKKAKAVSADMDDGCVNNINQNMPNTGCTLESSNDANNGKAKLKRRSFTYAEKLRIINLVEKHSKSYVCNKFKIDVCLLNKWIKKLSDIQQVCSRKYSKNLKKTRSTNTSEVDKELYTWFLKVRANDMPISGVDLKEKAIEISNAVGIEGFKASNGWLARWKKNHDLRLLRVTDEKSSAYDKAREYPQDLSDTMQKENLNTDQVLNLNETPRFWMEQIKILPDLTIEIN